MINLSSNQLLVLSDKNLQMNLHGQILASNMNLGKEILLVKNCEGHFLCARTGSRIAWGVGEILQRGKKWCSWWSLTVRAGCPGAAQWQKVSGKKG